MRIRRFHWEALVLSTALVSTAAMAEGEVAGADPTIEFGGFIRADYGSGDRYPLDRGEDQLGVSKAALATTVRHEGVTGVFVVGAERLTDGSSNADGDVDIKDAFIVLGDPEGPGFSWSFGAQALLFGLKPNGYPGDRSLQPSIEYGGAGAFAVANQAGPSVIGVYRAGDAFNIRFGAFDLDADNATGFAPATDGSDLSDNAFVQIRANDLFGSGLYASAGAESLYVGGAIDDSHHLAAAGVGYRRGPFDISVELMRVDAEIVGLPEDERYLVTEASFDLTHRWTAYADWADARELDASTVRLGAHYKYSRYVTLSSEYSRDKFGALARDVDSVDVRITFSY